MIRLPLLFCLALAAVAGEATVLRATWAGCSPGLTAVVVKHNEEDHAAADHRLATAAVADGAWSIPVATACESYALLVLRGEQVVWARSHLDPGEDLGAVRLPAEDGTLEGSVGSADGKPLAGICLRLWRKHDNSCSHWTRGPAIVADAEGGFALGSLARGTWGVAIEDGAWTSARREVTVGGGTAVVELVAQPGAVISGTVKDAQGAPVAGATVRLDGRSVQSAANGTFSLGGFESGKVDVRASAPGLALPDNAPREVKVVAGATASCDLVLQPTGSLRIALSADDPAFALPATVKVELEHRGQGGYEPREVPVAAGVAVLAEVAPGAYRLEVAAPGAGTARQPLTITSGAESAVEARLPRVYAYQGRLALPEGIDPASVTVRGGVEVQQGDSSSWTMHERTKLGADGVFRFAALEAGVLNLSFTAKGCVPQEHRIQVGPGGETEGSFALTRGRTVAVVVRDPAGKPLAGVRVTIDAGRLDWDAETGEDGVANLDGVADGPAELKIDHDEFVPHQAKITVDAACAPEVAMQTGLAITGTVLDADGKPLAGARISAWGRSVDGSQNRSATSAADGTFRLAGLRAGTVRLNVHHDGDTVVELDAVAAGAQGVRLQAKGKTTLTIVVTGPDGAPLPGIALTLDPQGAPNQELVTDAQGRATVELRRGVRYRIYGKPEKFRAVQRSGQVPETGEVAAVAISLDQGRSLRGTLLGQDGKPVAGMTIQVRSYRERESENPAATPEADGAFALDGLPPGPCQIAVVFGDRHQILQRDLLIPATGEVPALALRLPGLGTLVGKLPGVDGKRRAMVAAADPVARVHAWGEVGADGAFRIENLPQGDYTVTAEVEGADGSERQLRAVCQVRAGAEASAVFAEPPPASATQRVAGHLDRTAPGCEGDIRLTLVPDAPATFGALQNQNQLNAQVGEDGTFAFPAVPAGPYILFAQLQGKERAERSMWRSRIAVADRPLDLRLVPRGLAVPVRALDPAGQPLPGVWLTAIPDEGDFVQRRADSAMGQTGADGTAQVRWLDGPAMCSLMVRHNQHGQFVLPGLAVRPGMAPIEVRFAERAELRGTVAAPSGAVVHIVALMGDGMAQDEVVADEAGAYVFADGDRLHPGTWDLYAYAGGCAVGHRRIELSAAAAGIDFALVPSGRIVIRTIVPAGRSAAGLAPEVRDARGEEVVRPRLVWLKRRYPQVALAPLEADGSGEIDGLAPGRYTVTLPGAEPVAVEVVAGETAVAAPRLP